MKSINPITDLWVAIDDSNLALIDHFSNGFQASSIQMTLKFSKFEILIGSDFLFHLFSVHKKIHSSVDLTLSRSS